MCGVGGIRVFAAGPVPVEALHEMTRVMEHRGPDESAVWVGDDIGLAHTRLPIIDVEHSHQPMQSADGRWVLAFNGEIFNHAALRAHLDYPFRTSGDTEVVVAGLAVEGISFVERLEGQFAFVAHDLRTDTTHLVRDRLGVLPLHYRHVPGGIAFGSEAKVLLAVGPRPEVDHRSLHAYLGSRSVPAPDTLFEGVKKVRPAHRLAIMPGGHVEEAHYWSPPECDREGTWSPQDAVEAVGDGIREAVRAALVADVPVGAYLSGGLDSSLIVAHVRQVVGDEPVHTFSAGFGDHPQDELPWARRVSALLGTRHHEVVLDAGDFERLWGRLTWHRDAPISEASDVAVYGLARAAREHVRVVLSGEGGDELFAGYPKYRFAQLAEHATRLPAGLRTGLAGPVERRLGRHARARTALRAIAAGDVAEQHDTWFAPFTGEERRRLLGTAPPADRRAAPASGVDAVDRMLRHDLRQWLPDNLLERGDRMSMAASLELRPPLLDHHLVELAFRLPTSVKVRSGTTKWVLREVARPLLPPEVVDRPKVGFRVPLDSWFRSGLRDTARDRLTGSGSWVAQTLDGAAVRDLLDRHERGANEEIRLWTLLCLEMWHECFFGSTPVVPGPRGDHIPTRPATHP
ncbi:asparagine synthase (glutamine-hydrolyzing) [Nocardioides baculatus]|uniref:asparagine synthase (glutamine-hydrolyzing) n=1 Tax=Nocardioides baculatus TaxID=2801337 RepID=A0ABS1L9Y9_9ACTN|nr:asparagine synthase (glutamine-hydrolyzing) [Nocardioides baculatus]MBL0748499.1 asparagine synthase (glutamine-hydrolyzing) [Nocardioides baculatus]